MSKNIVASRVEKLEEQVQKLSRNVETLLAENTILHQKSNKSDEWIVLLISGYREAVQRVGALEARVETLEGRCSTLEDSIDLETLELNLLNTTATLREEKSLNIDQLLGQTLQSWSPQDYELTGLAQGEFMPAMEFESPKPDFQGNTLENPLGTGIPTPPNDWHPGQSYGNHTFPEMGQNGGGFSTGAGGNRSIAAIPTGRQRKTQEMQESGKNTTLSSSNSTGKGIQLTFINTFS
ncbi:hypothetical protein HOY82DRAFT_671884 [Tuber indicum]|nr:hypothetical protein HOY82DRAFT_671884 [Tuber indicum]